MKRAVYSSLAALALLACAGGAAWLQRPAPAADVASGAVRAPSPVAELVVAGLGGFRSLAAEVVWFRAERLQDAGRYAEMAQLATFLTFLEPHAAEVWAFAGWNLAYNISVMMPTPEDRWRWVRAALVLLRDDGLRLNPNDPVLYKELAWLFLLKMGTGLDTASGHYRAAWRAEVASARGKGDWRALKMDASLMKAVEAEYGALDWSDPLASALYWAHQGLVRAARPALRRDLRQVVYQTLMVASRADARFAPRALAELRTAQRESPNPVLEKIIAGFAARYRLVP